MSCRAFAARRSTIVFAAGAAVEQAVRVPGEVALYRLRDIVVRLEAAAAYRGAHRGVDALRFRAERRHSVKRVPEDVPRRSCASRSGSPRRRSAPRHRAARARSRPPCTLSAGRAPK